MAIYSLHHGTVGRATQAQPGTAGAHLRYITRVGAARIVMAEHMPQDRNAARSWMDSQEAADRKNARVIDKLMVALPVELDATERVQLVREFVADVTGGRTPWMAAIHDRNEDAHNPHAHIVIRDRDIATGKRAIGLSEKGSTERLREAWELAANRALERAGLEIRIDRRTLEAQGIAREPGIHVGPNVYEMERQGVRPVSVAMEIDGRVVNWPEIDQGRTRAERQREIEAANDHELEKSGGKSKDRDIAAGIAFSVASPERESERRPTPDPNDAGRHRHKEPDTIAAVEKGRLAAAIERGWERLTGLAQRLEAAWQRIVQRHEPLQPSAARLQLGPQRPSSKIETDEPECLPDCRSEPELATASADAPSWASGQGTLECVDRPPDANPSNALKRAASEIVGEQSGQAGATWAQTEGFRPANAESATAESRPPPPVTMAAEVLEEKRKRRFTELLAEQVAKRPPAPAPGSGPTFGR